MACLQILLMKILRILSIHIIFIFFSVAANAQSFLSISTGISTNVNQNGKSFYHVPICIQWKPGNSRNSPFLFELDYGIPLITKGSGDAYSLNPQLPEKVSLTEDIRASIFTISVGFQIHLLTNKKNNTPYLDLFPLAISSQSYKVTYKNYDKENYEVMNPDLNRETGGLAMAMALVYNFGKKQDMMAMIRFQSPTTASKNDYPHAFKSIAPLQLTFGYNFFYKK